MRQNLIGWVAAAFILAAGESALAYTTLSSVQYYLDFNRAPVNVTPTWREQRSLSMFRSGFQGCYNRNTMPWTMAWDGHNHFLPFGGNVTRPGDIIRCLRGQGVVGASIFGIGQQLPPESGCRYYLAYAGMPEGADCGNVTLYETARNDVLNRIHLRNRHLRGVLWREFIPNLTFTFFNLHNSTQADIDRMEAQQRRRGALFGGTGEVNVWKQAIEGNKGVPVNTTAIDAWAPRMAYQREMNMPFNMHADLGNNTYNTLGLARIEYILDRYPLNVIIWNHLGGMSKELTNRDVDAQVALLSSMLQIYPNLYIDFSWRVNPDTYMNTPGKVAKWVALFNKYPTRFLPGTDFVASHEKTCTVLAQEVRINSVLAPYLSDEAFTAIFNMGNFLRLYRNSPIGSRIAGLAPPPVCKGYTPLDPYVSFPPPGMGWWQPPGLQRGRGFKDEL